MKRLVILGLLVAGPAMAQQPTYTPTSTVLLDQALRCESVASQQIAALQKQVADVTAERDKLKAEAAKAPAQGPTVNPTPPATTPN